MIAGLALRASRRVSAADSMAICFKIGAVREGRSVMARKGFFSAFDLMDLTIEKWVIALLGYCVRDIARVY